MPVLWTQINQNMCGVSVKAASLLAGGIMGAFSEIFDLDSVLATATFGKTYQYGFLLMLLV